jgi:ABC-type multidrug transport system fused ATPase/permease subunit
VEERLKGSVPWKFYYRFFTGPGGFVTAMMFLFITLAQLARIFSDWWLGEWSNNKFNLGQNEYIEIYAGISVVVGILMYLKGKFFANFIISSSAVIQRRFIQTLLKTPLSWFDVTPTGRILARATKDQDDLDNSLAFNVQFAVQSLFTLFSSMVLISVATPVYLVVAVISGFVYYKLIGLYMNSSREIKRLEANSRAPLITHIQETINGTYVVRAFDKTKKFSDKFFEKQKTYIVALVNQNITNRWINLVTDLFSILTIAAAGYFGVSSVALNIGNDSTNLIGLALVWGLQISTILSFTLRVMADTESNMNAVVRLYDYVDNNPSEASFEERNPANDKWPDQGEFKINNISYKYRPELPTVIKNISFDIESRAKIGIVGRTGSGKSTMTLGLLRIL